MPGTAAVALTADLFQCRCQFESIIVSVQGAPHQKCTRYYMEIIRREELHAQHTGLCMCGGLEEE